MRKPRPVRPLGLGLVLALAACGDAGGGAASPPDSDATTGGAGGSGGAGGGAGGGVGGAGGSAGGALAGGTADTGPTGGATPDAGVDATVGPDAFVIPPGGEPCTFSSDCPYGDCIEDRCNNERPASCIENGDADCPEGETCGGFNENFYCMRPCELAGDCAVRTRDCTTNFECGQGTSCHDGRCVNNCETDADCKDRYCFDGECRPYAPEWNADGPTPLGQPGQLFAGVAVVPLDFPVGVELGGYGARPGPTAPEDPYAFALGGSDRFFEGQDVRVVVLSTADELVLLVRLPLCWSSDLVLSHAAHKLQQRTGVNYVDNIVASATHSHSQIARYWTIVPETGFGVFGHGAFSTEVFEGITDSVADAMEDALADVQPASVGYALRDAIDPQGKIHSDRRGENPDFKDDSALVLRVDDAQGQPMAGLIRLALHGTHMEETWVTGDAPGAVEAIATQKLSAREGREVPVMFFNGNAGDVSPRGDDVVAESHGKIQVVGHRMWPIFEEMFDSIIPRADLDMELITRRIPITYKAIGYDRAAREFRSRPDGAPQIYGGFQCVKAGLPAEAPPYADGQYACAIDLESFRGAPVPEFMKTTLSAWRLGDLIVATLPGEPVSQLGQDLTDAIAQDAAAAGHADYQVTDFGYSQDHHLYLVPEADWLRGGYEASQNVWGPKFADYIARQARAVAAELFTVEREVVETGIKPSYYEFLPDDTVPPTATAGLPGGVFESPAGTVPRGALMKFRFNGGHPGVDRPYALLERRRDDGEFVPATRPGGGLPYDNTLYETLTLYRGNYVDDHTWELEWELPFDAPLGHYRVHVTGHYYDGQDTQPYDALAAEGFDLGPATLTVRAASAGAGQIAVKVNYPQGPSNDDGQSPFEALASTGHLLRADPHRGTEGAARTYAFLLGAALRTDAPVHLEIRGTGQAALDVAPVAETVDFELVTSRAADGTEGRTPINGWPTSRVGIGAPAPGHYTVTVRDADGNTGTAEVDVL